MPDLEKELAAAMEKIDAVGNEHSPLGVTAPSDMTAADLAAAPAAILMSLLRENDIEALVDFARENARLENHPLTTLMKGFFVGAVWQRERLMRGDVIDRVASYLSGGHVSPTTLKVATEVVEAALGVEHPLPPGAEEYDRG